MLKYLVIVLDDSSESYCHYSSESAIPRLMPIGVLRKAILFGMKENLNIQFIYPRYELPLEYQSVINTVDHTDIKSIECAGVADITIIDDMSKLDDFDVVKSGTYLIRTNKAILFSNYGKLNSLLGKATRVNIIITDIETFTDNDLPQYENVLTELSDIIESIFVNGGSPQINLLTDRMILKKMNNCNAGCESIAIAPNGRFYICPAFYYDDESSSIGDLVNGINIKNKQLYSLDYAPICRRCDAFQCKRCVWLNKKKTLEVNTPGHIQCVISHMERNASRKLMNRLRSIGTFLPEYENIKEISYLDPFVLIINNNEEYE